MEAIKRFLSPKRMWRNLWTHFAVPMGICIAIVLYLFFSPWNNDNILDGIVMALPFSTAASCIRRRFGVPMFYVWVAAAVGMIAGFLLGSGDVSYWLQVVSVGVCVIVSCWTKRFYLQILLVPGWFVLCLAVTWFLECCVLGSNGEVIAAFLMIAIPFTLAPYLFLGGLPFGDEDFRA